MSFLQQILQGLKGKNEEARLSAAIQLQHYMNTEMREVSAEQRAKFIDLLNHHIFEMMSNSDNNEKKGGILAIVSQISVDEGSHFPLYRAANYLRNIFPTNDTVVMEMASQALGRLAAAGGNHRTEYIEFQVRRAIEWLSCSRNEGKRGSAVLILRELAVSAPTIFYLHIQSFFDEIFNAARDPKISIREAAVSALNAALQLTVHRETKDSEQKPHWYRQTFDEAMNGFKDTGAKDKLLSSSKEDRIHTSLLIINELVRIGTKQSQIVLEEAMAKVSKVDISPRKSGKFFSKVSSYGQSRRNYCQHQSSLLLPSSKTTPGCQSVALLAETISDYWNGSSSSLANSNMAKQSSSSNSVTVESADCRNLILDKFDKICEEVLNCKFLKSPHVQFTFVSLLPRLAAASPHKFAMTFLEDAMAYIMTILKKDRDRSYGYYTIGLLLLSLKKYMSKYIPRVLDVIKAALPSKEFPAKKQRNYAFEPAMFGCISMIVVADVETIAAYVDSAFVQSMIRIGLHPALMVALYDLSVAIPTMKKIIYTGIMEVLSLVLFSNPNSLGSAESSATVVLSHTIDPSNASNLVVALRTLAMFHSIDTNSKQNIWERTPSHRIMSFVTECSSAKFLCHEEFAVRIEAVRTVVVLLHPYIPPHVTTANNIRIYPNLSLPVSKVLNELLTLVITDKDSGVRVEVMQLLGDAFDCYLAQPESLSVLFIANHDEVFEVRDAAICTMGRLAEHNPAHVMPFLRKRLIELLAELQHSGISKNKMQSTRLLGQLASTAPMLIRPYVHTIMQALIWQLKENKSNAPVSVGIMQTIGEYAEVGGSEIGVESVILELMPIILDMLLAHSSYSKREVALVSLGKLVQSTGYVVEPYEKYPMLLDTLLSFLKTEHSLSFRKEVIKVLGLIGALDPFKHKVNQSGNHPADGMTVPERKEVDEGFKTGSSDILISLGNSSEDFYLAVSIASLMNVLKDPLLSAHHMDVIQAVEYMINTLGLKCVPFLSQIIPTYLATIRSCQPNIREFLFINLGSILLTVKQHARNFMGDIFSLVKEYWTISAISFQNTLITLCEQIASALGGDFKAYLPEILPHTLKVFIHDDTAGRTVTIKMLQALQVFGRNLDAYIHLYLPPVMKLIDTSEATTNARKTALDTLQTWSQCVDLREHMSEIVLPIIRVISSYPEHRGSCMDILTSLIQQFGRSYSVYVPVMSRLIEKHRILHPAYDMMVSNVMLNENWFGKGGFTWMGQSEIPENLTPSSSTEVGGTKKHHVNTQNLQKAWKIVRRVSKDDWLEWLRRLSVELLKESPSSALKACGALANTYAPLSRALFNAAFLSCWSELNEAQQDELVLVVETALQSPDVPAEVTHTLLNLAEFMEHTDKGPLPLKDSDGVKLLGETATKCRAFAKALHYKELEFYKHVTPGVIGDLININSKLGQPDAAEGILLYHEKTATSASAQSVVGDLGSSEEGEMKASNVSNRVEMAWYERLHKWEEAKNNYWYNLQYAASLDPKSSNVNATNETKLGYMRCLEALGQWEDLHSFVEHEWSLNPDETYQRKMARLAVAASWGLGKWESMDEYTCMIPREQYDGPFYRAVMAIHQNHFIQAKECMEEAREILDSELTALAGESYNRAYSALVNCQMLAELEEVVCYKLVPERRPLIKQSWWDRLQGCEKNLEDWQRIIQVRSLVLSPHDDIRSWLKFASLCMKHGRKGLAKKVLIKLLEVDPSKDPHTPLPTTYPFVSFAYMKYMWKQGQHRDAILCMQQFVNQVQAMPQTLTEVQKTELNHLMSRCYLKLGQWQQHVYGITEDHGHEISRYYKLATDHGMSWYKGWHSWAVMNFEYVQFYKRKLDGYHVGKKKALKTSCAGVDMSLPIHEKQTTYNQNRAPVVSNLEKSRISV